MLLRRCVEVRGRLMGTRGEEFDDKGSRRGAARAAAVAARKTLPSDGQIRAHAPELITFLRGRKTDWGKKCRILEDFFCHGWTKVDTDQSTDVTDGWGLVSVAKMAVECLSEEWVCVNSEDTRMARKVRIEYREAVY